MDQQRTERFDFQRPPDPAQPKKSRPPAVRVLIAFFALGMVCIPLAVGAGLYVAFAGVSDVFRGFQAPALAAPSVALPEWSGRERVNFLLLGTDHRDGETDVPRSDTIIVLTLDPESKTAGILSLPRDLWVTIPGYGNERINAAFELGEQEKPGGGPDLARKTVEQLIGVPIHHYALIGFTGFEKLVDQMGGVMIDVERPIKDNEYPDQNYSMRRLYFQPGLQRMDGFTALTYVRTRHADSDYGRARRQQQFLLALRKQTLQLNLIPKIPTLLNSLSDAVKTDLRPQDVVGLARTAKDIDPSKITNRVVDESMTTHWVTPAGAQVEVPDKAAVKAVVQEVFGK
jgi:LCP family protein required for cell wall assembly